MTLSTGDLVHITVFRQKDLELEVRIPEGGEIAYPLIGDVKASGRTSKEVETEIKRRLEEKYLHKAGVTLTITQYAPRMVYVLGGVQKPGNYEFSPNRRLTILQLISTAGGYTDRAYKEFAQLVRRNDRGERELIRFSINEVEKAVAKGQVEADLEVGPDDLLVIPSAARSVYVLGQVNTPRNIDMPTDSKMTVSMALSQAGSWTKFAATSRIMVLRQPPGGEPRRFTVDLDAVVNGDLEKDLELMPGDVVWVPQRSIF
jgi:polysaccharide export outer membrane protein